VRHSSTNNGTEEVAPENDCAFTEGTFNADSVILKSSEKTVDQQYDQSMIQNEYDPAGLKTLSVSFGKSRGTTFLRDANQSDGSMDMQVDPHATFNP
jgi:uncharacterized protein YciU (UPF0263 family)